jgi:predicted secreted protein
MRSIWQSLAWKEWNEHKWKLVSILVVVWCLMGCIVFIGGLSERRVLAESFHVSVILAGIPMAVFVGLSIAAGEQSRGTLPFLQALPVPMWRVALHKLGFALVSLIIPILLSVLAVVAVRILLPLFGIHVDLSIPMETFNGRAVWSRSWFIDVAFVASAVACSLVIWSAACGINRKDEVSAGAVALAVMVVWWLVLFLLWAVLLRGSREEDTARLRAVGAGSAPLGFVALGEISGKDSICIALGYFAVVAVHILLSARYVLRFGRTAEREVRSPRVAIGELRKLEFLAPPRRFPITAIAWKQFCESGPITLVGLFVIIAIVAFYCSADMFVAGKWLGEVGMIYRGTATIFGLFIALVAGIGVSLHDLSPGLNTFWRSRPIRPSVWFWTKFITGLVIVMAAIYAPIGFIAALGDTSITANVTYPGVYMLP